MTLMAPFERYRDPGYPAFPPRNGMTFGEVVSSYNMFGNAAAKRHSHMTFHQETHVPDDKCTIHEKVALLRDNKDCSKSWATSSRGLMSPRLSTRSRTPSPWMPRRPRSSPSTPRCTTPNALRPSASDRFFKENADLGFDKPLGDNFGSRYGARFDYNFSDEATGGIRRERSYPPIATTSTGALGDFPTVPEFPGRSIGEISGVAGTRPATESIGVASGGRLPSRTVPLNSRSVYDSSGRSGGITPMGNMGFNTYSSDLPGRPHPQADARAISFVRLNSFLLRTHITSLVSALAEDGWLEGWEKERLSAQAREDSHAWAQAFLRTYMRFMETEDVPMFVASLRSQIV